MKMDLLDIHENTLREGDYIAYATSSRIWVGTITKLLEYTSDYRDPTYKIQIRADEADGTTRHMTFEHLGWKIYKIKDA